MKTIKIEKKLFLFAAMAFVLDACNLLDKKGENAVMVEAAEAIAASNAIYFDAFVKNDSSIFVNRYAEDACIMAPFAPPACGRENAAKFFREAYDKYGLRNGRFITKAIYGSGNEYVIEEGLWQSLNAKGELFDDGKFLVLWKKTSGGWKMYRDSFSSNRTASNTISNLCFYARLAFDIAQKPEQDFVRKHNGHRLPDLLTCRYSAATNRFIY